MTDATLGGPGFRRRSVAHRDDIGDVWSPANVNSEYGELVTVTLARPHYWILPSPNELLMHRIPIRELWITQAENLAKVYTDLGVTVVWAESKCDFARCASPNYVFQRDLYFMTPDGAVLARPASEIRALEPVHMAHTLTNQGIPIIASPTGGATLEGSDVLWLSPVSVVVGIGSRTNSGGLRLVRQVLDNANIGVRHVYLPPTGVQHLLGIVVRLDEDLAIVNSRQAPSELYHLLANNGVNVIETTSREVQAEVDERRSMNVVVIRPREVVMPSGCPHTAELFHKAGVITHEVNISEYVAAAGGIGCATGIAHRKPV